ncbi:uncharacterized protein LOC124306817 [Neodiprion virginianus]|uniref:uncharacterized protein LOC124306817 n=1 Tax=Neodiprion virginianus TaxID=2961670 RepID=UPI001EE6E3F3|nr:uncharacterized protein LOC124306817 [Neodiprion virginianus]
MSNSNYSEVHSWFEKSGVISSIRTHIRQNLVIALKNNASSREVKTDFRSAKQYVYDMLIAEYLLKYNYFYTLSVFASETPLLINLHQQAEAYTQSTEDCKKNKLPNDYVHHALQTLGISPEKPNGQNILSHYADGDSPLIFCILKSLILYFSNTLFDKNDADKVHTNNQQTQTDHIVPTETFETIALLDAKKKLFQQKELFGTQLKNKEFELREQALSIERQLASLNGKLQHAQNLMQLVDSKENRLVREKLKNEQNLASRELELSVKERLLSEEADRLQKERVSYRTFEGDVKKLQEELIKVRNEIPAQSAMFSTIKKDECVQTDISVSASNVEVRLLNEEKQELTNLIREQQSRIEELTLRVVTLSRQLEEALLSRASNSKNMNANNGYSESSSTEDILQDAKMRLRRLEAESLRADQYFQSCITISP